jgi:hypothetical protein
LRMALRFSIIDTKLLDHLQRFVWLFDYVCGCGE